MSDLHAAIVAKLDELERKAERMRTLHGISPSVLAMAEYMLRGLAEDRDILRRHAPRGVDVWTSGKPQPSICVNCSDLDQDTLRIVGWPCWDVISLARRHGVAPVLGSDE